MTHNLYFRETRISAEVVRGYELREFNPDKNKNPGRSESILQQEMSSADRMSNLEHEITDICVRKL